MLTEDEKKTLIDTYSYVDKQLADILKRLPPKQKSTCTKGCYHCCKEPAYADKREVELMLANLTPLQLAEVTQRTQLWWNSFTQSGYLKTPKIDSVESLAKYRQSLLWCPFLDGKLCIAYESRPTSCRTHHATKSAKRCESDYERRSQEFIIYPPEFLLSVYLRSTASTPNALIDVDHIGVWLAHILLGKTEHSAIAHTLIVDNQPARNPIFPNYP